MTDQWDWYRKALAAKEGKGSFPPIVTDRPESGMFFSKAGRSGGRIPVLIMDDANGEKFMRYGTKEEHEVLSADMAARRWAWCAGHIVTKDEYATAYTTGTWPDGTPTTAVDGSATKDDNLPSDPFDRLMAEVTDKMADAKALLAKLESKPADKTAADTAKNIQSALLSHGRTADAMHKAEKQPFLDGGKAVDDKFRFRDKIETTAKQLYNVFNNWMKAEDARLSAEAERKFNEQRAAAEKERQRIEAERAKLKADDPIAYHTSDPEPLPELPLAPEPVRVNAGGGVGRAAGLRDVYSGEIIDYAACLKHYGTNLKVREIIEKLVAADVKTHKMDAKIPGVNVKRERKAA